MNDMPRQEHWRFVADDEDNHLHTIGGGCVHELIDLHFMVISKRRSLTGNEFI